MRTTDENGLTVQHYSRGEALPIESNDLADIISIGLAAVQKKQRSDVKYSDSEDGLEAFRERSADYLRHVQEVNSNAESDRKLLIDVESWCVFLGITRQTLSTYSKRGKEWADFIGLFKEIIVSAKKQLAFYGKIPPVLAIFDWTNNHGYHSTNEFKIVPPTEEQEAEYTEAELMERAKRLPGFTKPLEEDV